MPTPPTSKPSRTSKFGSAAAIAVSKGKSALGIGHTVLPSLNITFDPATSELNFTCRATPEVALRMLHGVMGKMLDVQAKGSAIQDDQMQNVIHAMQGELTDVKTQLAAVQAHDAAKQDAAKDAAPAPLPS